MSSVSAVRDPRAVKRAEDRVNLFLLPSTTPTDMADGQNSKSGRSIGYWLSSHRVRESS